MKILSIQVGLPREVEFNGKVVKTGIFKDPVTGPVQVNTTNLAGDRQADLTVHGGPDKAVYAYSFDAYDWWKNERPADDFPYGAFGENLTVDHLPEDKIYIGDTYELGGTILQVAQPRFPCYKLGVKYNDLRIIKTFMKAERPGVYFRVLKEGKVEAGDTFKLVSQERVKLSVVDLSSFILGRRELSREDAIAYLGLGTLPDLYRESLRSVVEGA